jgi:hypothetical protein
LPSRVELLLAVAGRTDAYGEEQPDGSMKTVHKPLTRQVLEDHLAGRRNIGVFLIGSTGLVKAGCFVLREHSRRARLALVRLKEKLKEMREAGALFLIEDLPGEGYRGWLLLPMPAPAGLVACLLRGLADEIEAPGMSIETAPSEEEVEGLGFPSAREVLKWPPSSPNLLQLLLGRQRGNNHAP